MSAQVKKGQQADVEVVDRFIREFSFFLACDAARHVIAAQVVQEFEQVGGSDLANILVPHVH
jgi:hypothetical protein